MRKCRYCRSEETIVGKRVCESCYSRKKCSSCKKYFDKKYFNENKNRCSSCEELKKYKICIKCKRSVLRSDFATSHTKICNDCKIQYKFCKKCKNKYAHDMFDYRRRFCKSCVEEIEQKLKLNQIKKLTHVLKKIVLHYKTCKICKNNFFQRKSFIHEFICETCKYADIKNKNLVECKICNQKMKIVTSSHIKNHGMTYDEYLEKFGRESIYSQMYKEIMEKSSKKSCTEKTRKILSEKSKNWWLKNYDEICKKLKIAQNTESAKINHEKGSIRYYSNRSKEEEQKHKDRAKRTWQNPETRAKRIESINTEESIKARSRGARNSLSKRIARGEYLSKPQLMLETEIINTVSYKVEREFLVDFYHIDIALPELKIAIECDGDYFHGNPRFYNSLNYQQKQRQTHDRRRNTFLKNHGWNVLRFWEYDIHHDMNGCIAKIVSIIKEQQQCLQT